MDGQKKLSRADAFRALQLKEGATPDEIKKAFRRLAIRYHPDKLMGAPEKTQAEAAEQFKQLGDAKDLLLNNGGDSGKSSEPAPGGDFFSTLKAMSPEGPSGPARNVSQAPAYREREPKPQRTDSRQAAKERRSLEEKERKAREAEERLVRKDLQAANPKEKEYVEELYRLSARSHIRFPERGFLKIAKELVALDYPEERKREAMKLISKCSEMQPQYVPDFIEDICESAKNDSDSKFRAIMGVLKGSFFYSEILLKDTYPHLSGLDEKAISETPEFIRFTNAIGLRITFGFELANIIKRTIEHAGSLSAVFGQAETFRAFMGQKTTIEAYVSALPAVTFPGPERQVAQAILANLTRLYSAKDLSGVISKIREYPGNLANVRDLSGKVYHIHPFRAIAPLTAYSAMERICLGTVEKGVPSKEVVRLLERMRQFERASLESIEEEAIRFFAEAERRGIASKEAVDSFSEFVKKKSMAKPAWSKEMKSAYNALTPKYGNIAENDKEKLRLIIAGFFASAPQWRS